MNCSSVPGFRCKIRSTSALGFSQWNRNAERRIKESGVSYTILRGNYFMQNPPRNYALPAPANSRSLFRIRLVIRIMRSFPYRNT